MSSNYATRWIGAGHCSAWEPTFARWPTRRICQNSCALDVDPSCRVSEWGPTTLDFTARSITLRNFVWFALANFPIPPMFECQISTESIRIQSSLKIACHNEHMFCHEPSNQTTNERRSGDLLCLRTNQVAQGSK